ncbi:MAG: hypothetical protein DLM59_02220 [Pseudonocardiales bacterium]|nr:MAG: hypothetical protein DLM59_02220 [Pseudonocardiales bacterium]
MGTTGGTNTELTRGAITCSGLAVGAAMPATTACSRAYSAPAAAESPSGGARGLDPGETFTITYRQIISNTAPCSTITNTASTAGPGDTFTWIVTVTNNGPGAMEGPSDLTANPLAVADTALVAPASAPAGFTSTGNANGGSSCTYAGGSITCPAGLAAGASQVFTYTPDRAGGYAGRHRDYQQRPCDGPEDRRHQRRGG